MTQSSASHSRRAKPFFRRNSLVASKARRSLSVASSIDGEIGATVEAPASSLEVRFAFASLVVPVIRRATGRAAIDCAETRMPEALSTAKPPRAQKHRRMKVDLSREGVEAFMDCELTCLAVNRVAQGPEEGG